jgi:hypothetical protein
MNYWPNKKKNIENCDLVSLFGSVKYLFDFDKKVFANIKPSVNPLTQARIDLTRKKLWLNASGDYHEGAQTGFQTFLSIEIDYGNYENKFFRFCKISTYKSHFNQRLKDFQEEIQGAELIDFIRHEGLIYANSFNEHELFSHACEKDVFILNLARNKTLEFLNKKANEIGFTIIVVENSFSCTKHGEQPSKIDDKKQEEKPIDDKNGIKWHSNKRDLVELIESLYSLGTLKGNKENIYNSFEILFGVDLKNHAIDFNKICDRNFDIETKFLDELSHSLSDKIKDVRGNR